VRHYTQYRLGVGGFNIRFPLKGERDKSDEKDEGETGKKRKEG